MDRNIIEMAPFKMAEGIREEELLQASAELQRDFLGRQKGFLKRELLRRDERNWTDIVYWTDRGSAEQAMKQAAESPVCLRYFGMMTEADHDLPETGVILFERVESYE